MSEQRDALLLRVQKALGRSKAPSKEMAAADLETRLPESIPRPAWEGDRVNRFISRLEAAAGSYARIDSPKAIPAAVQSYLQGSAALNHPIGMTPHPLLMDLAWPAGFTPQQDMSSASSWGTAIGVGYRGIAETGSIVMPSGPTRPTTLNFLPDQHIVVLKVSDIVDYMEAVWEQLLADGGMPRTVNVITGPSRTADVEQTLQLGAHGPRSLHVLLLD